MKAVVLNAFGDIDQLEIKDIPVPSIGEDEVLIRAKAISINPVDSKIRKGIGWAPELLAYDPIILGWDISGIVEAVGTKVTQFKTGDEVFGMVNFTGHGKAYAEYVAAPATHLAKKPRNISHEEAAASTLAALTAWQAFNSYGKLRPNDKTLIHAASGGVGHFAVQIAKHLGAYVIGTSSAKNKNFVLGLGADEHIDYKSVKFEEVLQDLDFVLDAISGDNFVKSIQVLKHFGTIIGLPSGYKEEDEKAARSKHLHASFYMKVYSSGADMQHIAGLLEREIIKPHIYKVYALDEIKEAHQQIESGTTVGKIVVGI
ncbi:NADP-dependent oxidoreductase [Elizabethkingia ursingii]|uniref:NADP-dependent oxidoreductase n=1 Tax=Elizabethkingia ursingii TaxID=1756150 RepID=UPI0020132229|nr:NADP-dependent oxidoreductase [Elizabethkingia ursingii]MCL1670604.1 NADP-dependent oxidoreductase [Elizabethkingia ursingii]